MGPSIHSHNNFVIYISIQIQSIIMHVKIKGNTRNQKVKKKKKDEKYKHEITF